MGDFWSGLGDVAKTWATVFLSKTGDHIDNALKPGNGVGTDAYEGNPDLAQYGPSPYSSPLKSMVSGMSAPAQVTADNSSYQAKDMSKSALPQYDAMRSRLSSQYSQNQAQGQDAIDRQFAAAGGGPGNGAQAKQTENLVNATAAAKSADTQNLDAQEQQTRTGLQQAENDKAFQSGEATKGRVAQANKFNAQTGLQYQSNLLGANTSIAKLDSDWAQSQAEAKNNEYNKALSDFQAKHSGGLLGGGGFLGLGL